MFSFKFTFKWSFVVKCQEMLFFASRRITHALQNYGRYEYYVWNISAIYGKSQQLVQFEHSNLEETWKLFMYNQL